MTDIETRLAHIEKMLQDILRIVQSNHYNTVTIYRRTAALALMVEAVGEGREPRITKSMRAEIDASLNPKEFSDLATNDPDAFIHRYGKMVYSNWQKSGMEGVLPIGDFAPTKTEYKKKMQ